MARRHGTLGTNKKGSIIDIVFIAIGLLVFAITVLFGFKIVSEWNDNIAANPNIPIEAKVSTDRLMDTYSGTIDRSFLFLAVGLAIGAFILASLVRVHPIFLPFFFIALVFVIFFSAVFSNIYQGMAENAALSAQADQLIFISNILTFLPFIVGIFGGILAIVMHKNYSDNNI